MMIVCELCGKKVEEGLLVINKGLDVSPFFCCNSCFDKAIEISLPEIIKRLKGGENNA